MALERLQKILARAGVASRRAAESLIVAGRVRVDGRVVTQLGEKADLRTQRVEVDGKRLVAEQLVYLVLHKPRGVVSTLHDPEGRPTVRELVAGVPGRVFPVGRLDFHTSGVLLMTNDGEFSNGLLHPRRDVPKTYVVKTVGVMKEQDIVHWAEGVELEDGKTRPADVRFVRHEAGKTWLEVTLYEGRNQQIRRMGDATGFRVMRLARLSFAGISSEGLAPGSWRELTPDELKELKKNWGVPGKVSAPPPREERAAPAARGRVHLGGVAKHAAEEGGGAREARGRHEGGGAREPRNRHEGGGAREARGRHEGGGAREPRGRHEGGGARERRGRHEGGGATATTARPAERPPWLRGRPPREGGRAEGGRSTSERPRRSLTPAKPARTPKRGG